MNGTPPLSAVPINFACESPKMVFEQRITVAGCSILLQEDDQGNGYIDGKKVDRMPVERV